MDQKDDVNLLKLLNKELRKYKTKLKFQYYDVCPFDEKNFEIMEIILKYVEQFESYYNKIFILTSLCDEYFKDSVPYLVKTYHYFLNEVYSVPIDESYLLILCDTIAKIKAFEYVDLYKGILTGPITQSAESIIKMLSEFCFEENDEIILSLVKKENLIPKAWIGDVSETCKYWCSYIALKCIVDKKDKKYLSFFNELLEDELMPWIEFTDSKYKNKLTLEWKSKYKLLVEKGIRIIK